MRALAGWDGSRAGTAPSRWDVRVYCVRARFDVNAAERHRRLREIRRVSFKARFSSKRATATPSHSCAACTVLGSLPRPAPPERRSWMAGFLFRLEKETARSGTVDAECGGPKLATGDPICLGRRTLRVVAVRDEDADQPPVLVVEDVSPG